MSTWDPPTPVAEATPAPSIPSVPSSPVVPPGTIVAVEGVTKAFGDLVAVSDVTFHVGAGVTALLGPNGAGKSTLFRVMCGLTQPSQGTVRILGADPRIDREVRGRIGLAPQQDALFDQLSAHRFVEIAGEMHALPDAAAAARTALDLVQLDHAEPKPIGAYSKGMRQRVKLAAALVNDPDVLILDEPLAGLDPVQRNRLIELFHDLGGDGRCVLVSSHVLDEVARLGSRVLVIAQGRLAATGAYRDLRTLMDDRPHRIRVRSDRARLLAATLVGRELVDGVSVHGDVVLVDTTDIDRFGRDIAAVARELDARLHELEPTDDDLESVFRYLVERR
jgi:ABC-2 type transport system ATP-binding protein